MIKSTAHPVLACFLVYAAFCSMAGWILSAAHALTGAGYLLSMGLFATSLFFVWVRNLDSHVVQIWMPIVHRSHRFFRRALPFSFLVISILVLISGAAYFMDSHDAQSYRIPRIYQWLDAGQWCWIDTLDQRQNDRGPVLEWMSLPLVLLTGTDRFVFLVNFVPFLLLPSLIFNTYVSLGVARKVAWYWMWLIPTALCYVLQAQTCANDMLAGFFVLAAVNLALNAARFRQPDTLALALLSYALATGVKPHVALLILPVGLALLPALGLARRWSPWFAGILMGMLFFSSYAPNAYFNYLACGDWTGLKLDQWQPPVAASCLIKFPINCFLILFQNFAPPVFPWHTSYRAWELHFLTTPFGHYLDQRFETGFSLIRPILRVDNAALGIPLTLILLFGIGATLTKDRSWCRNLSRIDFKALLRWAGFASFLLLLLTSNFCQIGRLACPFYLLAIPFLVASPIHSRLVRGKVWRGLAIVNGLMVALFLIFCPIRPLIPVNRCLAWFEMNSPVLRVLTDIYSTGQRRIDDVNWLYDAIPPQAHTIGQVRAWYNKESPLWYPYITRRVYAIRKEDTAASLRAKGIEYVVLSQNGLFYTSSVSTTEEWCRLYHAHAISERNCEDREIWTVVQLDSIPLNASPGTPPDVKAR